MSFHVRRAVESDRHDIALCVAEGFEQDFASLCKDINKIALAIEPGLFIDRFYVVEKEGEIVGVLAISDYTGRAARVDKASLKKNFGFIKGHIASLILKEEFETPIEYPATTGYIEFVAVRKNHRQKGVATLTLKESMALSGYQDFALDVTDINVNAIRCYELIGFKEFKRVPEKHAKQKGFNAKIYMNLSG